MVCFRLIQQMFSQEGTFSSTLAVSVRIVRIFSSHSAEKGASAAASSSLGQFGTVFISVALCLFAFTTLIGNFYYAEMGLKYLCGKTPGKKLLNTFRIIAALIVLAGSVMEFGLVWNTADVLMGFMALINLPVIIILSGPALKCMQDYMRQKKEGKDPVFRASDVGLKDQTDFWN